MIKSYLRIAFRSLWKNKVHSFINVTGLSLGIACCILIALYVKDEWTFDQFHSKASRIYRAWVKEDYGPKEQFFNTVTPFPLGPALKDNVPEVAAYVRFMHAGMAVRIGDKLFQEQITIVGQDFFKVFDFAPLQGETESVLSGQTNIVITRKIAEKYFGNDDPINKVISLQLDDSFHDFTVKTVLEDVPVNSSLQFGVLISDLNNKLLYNDRVLQAWFNIMPETYVLLNEGANVKEAEAKFPAMMKPLLGSDFKGKYTVGLQPLTAIHLDPSIPAGIAPVSNPRYSYILAAIALLVLTVACINFITLSVGRSMKRSKEVGIRKVVGAQRRQLVVQFIGEAVIVTLLSLIVGFLLALVNLPLFNGLSGKPLTLQPDAFMALLAGTLILVIGLFAGSYPAFILSGFKPIAILKGAGQTGASKQGLRKVLVGVQLVLSIFLISSTLIMREQLSYLQNKNLGFNKEQVAVVQLTGPNTGRLPARIKATFEKAILFKNELASIKGIASVTASSHDFGKGAWTNIGFTDDRGTYRTFSMNVTDELYIPALKMEMKAGRNFDADNPADSRHSIIVNEAFVKAYDLKDGVGKRIPGKGFQEHEIIGVVKDFNYSSLYTKVEPLVLVMDPTIVLSGSENININNSPIPKLLITLQADDMMNTIDKIKGVWSKINGAEEFSFTFVDQSLAAQYRNDQNLGKMVSIATLLAMVIGSLGLYALASLAMQNRVKEISIRKVLGATEQSLLVLLTKEYVYLIFVCLIVSVPVTWYLMSKWLHSFEYKIDISAQVFIVAGAVSFVVALCTISYQTIHTTRSQPAATLKYE